ncbi:unnamed protein product [Protopolystoma xenopodis]|uniref:Uncharacterized protein n=1 Tax=Protopolystoma xenopodis TaxID=117903 RepID=A0A3S5A6F8_9PLAT|nr:unnamed protein product [Protopolystoma xenopodis]
MLKKAPVITTPTPASSVNIGEAYRSSSGSLGSSTLATNNTAASETTSSTPLCGNELLTQASANRLLAELSSLSAARPLLRCSLGRPSLYRRAELDELDLLSDGDGEGDGNTVNGASSTSIGQDTLSASSTRMGASRRRAALGSDSVDTQSSTTLHRLYAHDLASLQDVLDRRALPGGPSQLIPQLRFEAYFCFSK